MRTKMTDDVSSSRMHLEARSEILPRVSRVKSKGGLARPAIMTISTYTAGTGLFPTW